MYYTPTMITIPKLQEEHLSPEKKREVIKQIKYWKEKRNALIIAHNYQIPGIQDVADYVGDSLELARKAAEVDNELLVFCGVHFMAESAKIFSPEKTVLIPDLKAGCSLASSIDAEELRKWKRRYPKALVVSYVNTTAEVKAESDYCVTSSNAVRVVNSIPENREIIFLPDMFLGDYVARKTGRKNFYVYPGECHVHAKSTAADIRKKLGRHPTAQFLIHPECGCVSECMHYVATKAIPEERTHILSTSGMVNYAKESPTDKFIVATETGMLHRLKKENPKKKFLPLRNDMVCEFMKMITLEKLLNSLKNLEFEVNVDHEIAKKARLPIERMLAIG